MHTRKAIFFGQPEWLELTKTTALVDPWVALTNLSVGLPALLEKLDALAGGKDNVLAKTALPMIESIETELASWHARYLANRSAKGPWLVEPSHLRYVKDLDAIPSLTPLYWFADFQAGNIQQCYWAILLGIQRVRKAFETASDELLSPTISQKDCAIQMAKCAAFSCQPRFGSVGRIAATVILKYASVAFNDENCHEEAQWCSALVGIIRADGVCQPPIFFVDQSHLSKNQKNKSETNSATTPTGEGRSSGSSDEQHPKITFLENYDATTRPKYTQRDDNTPPVVRGQDPDVITNAYRPATTYEYQSTFRTAAAA